MDVKSKGCGFTWTNNKEGKALVKKRFDRVLRNIDWRVTFPKTEVFALPTVGYDHAPLLLSLYLVIDRRRKIINLKLSG